jgi:hypothetical protein
MSGNRQGEVLSHEVERRVAEEDPDEHLPAQPAVFGIDAVGGKRWDGRGGLEKG